MTLRKINATFSSITKAMVRCKGKVLQKFLVEMIFGIICSKSLNLSEISRSLEKESKTSARYIHKRLNRNLGEYDLTRIKEQVQAKQCREIDDNTYIYFDPTDIVKPQGKKFEGMSLVADGSDEHKLKKGYPLISCIGLKNEEIIPIDLDLFSYIEETFVSKNQKLLYHIDGISERSNMNGIVVLDREFDGFPFIRHLQQRSIDFIIRMASLRKYYLKGKCNKSFERYEIIDRFCEIEAEAFFDIKVKKKLRKMKFTVKSVKVDLLGGTIDSPRTLTLIKAKSINLTMYLLTNLEDLSKEGIVEVFQAYLNRWKVEEYIRFVKQQYKLEKFQVIYLLKIRNLIQLLFIATAILAKISEPGVKFSKTRAILINSAKRTYKLPQKMKFFLYLVADGLAYVLRIITKKIIKMSNKVPQTQLKLNLGRCAF